MNITHTVLVVLRSTVCPFVTVNHINRLKLVQIHAFFMYHQGEFYLKITYRLNIWIIFYITTDI